MTTPWKPETLFFRQVHPAHRAGDQPTSQAFFPTPKDHDRLSLDDSRVVSAQEAWSFFTQVLKFESAGTWAVSLGEIDAAGDLTLTRAPVENPDQPEKNNPAHCLLDFSNLATKGQKKRRAQYLAIQASARGCVYKSPNLTPPQPESG